MKFTQNNSLNEIVEQAKPEFKLFWSESILQYIPEEMRNQPISSIKTLKTEWFEIPFPMEDILADANAMEHWEQVWNEHPLWDKETFTVDSNDVHSAALMEYFGEHGKEKKNGSSPVVIICPGGGYTDMSFHTEGTLIAERMMKDGYKTFILSYRVNPNLYPKPQLDLAMAIKYVRKHAAEFGIDPNNLMILGYESLREYLSVEHYVDKDYPSTFVWANADDSLVPASNAVRMGEALKEKGIRHKLNIYPSGEHGCNLGIGTSAEGWMEEMLEFFRN